MRLLKSHPILRLANSYLVDSPQPLNLSYLWNFGVRRLIRSMEPYGKVRHIKSGMTNIDVMIIRSVCILGGGTYLRTFEPNKTIVRSAKYESGGRGWLQSLVYSASPFVHGEDNELDTCKCNLSSGTVLRAIEWL